jgi:hypothetical protein
LYVNLSSFGNKITDSNTQLHKIALKICNSYFVPAHQYINARFCLIVPRSLRAASPAATGAASNITENLL